MAKVKVTKEYGGSTVPLTPNLANRWRLVVSYTQWPIYLLGKRASYLWRGYLDCRAVLNAIINNLKLSKTGRVYTQPSRAFYKGIILAFFPKLYHEVSRVTLHLPTTKDSCNFHTNKIFALARIQNRQLGWAREKYKTKSDSSCLARRFIIAYIRVCIEYFNNTYKSL